MPYKITEIETQKVVDVVCHIDGTYQVAERETPKYKMEAVDFKDLTMDEKCLLIEDMAQRIDELAEKSRDFENDIDYIKGSLPY